MKKETMSISSLAKTYRTLFSSQNCSRWLLGAVFMAIASPAPAAVDSWNQSKAVTEATDRIKTHVPVDSDKKTPHYFQEIQQSQSLQPIGLQPVTPVESVQAAQALNGQIKRDDDQAFVPLNRPTLQALITVQENLNPFAMDAAYSERISLPEALNCALAHNLAIESDFAGYRSQKYEYLAATSKFLPDLKGGYSLIGLHGSLPGSILGSSSNSSSTGSSSNINLPSHLQLLQAGFNHHVYQGGKILFGSLEQKHRLRASRAELKGSINDVLLESAKRYYNLVLNEALLEIRSQAVEISTEQLRLNVVQEKAGTATGLDVLQSQAQLASDEQNLVDQQSTRRQAAIQLAAALNSSFAQDLTAVDNNLRKKRLVPRRISLNQLLNLAIDNRPELKRYEELRLAAKRAILVAAAPLHPQIDLGGTVYGVGAAHSSTSSIYLLNFSVNWTLGGLGTTDLANIQQARWQARQADVQAKQCFQDVFVQVRTAYDQSLAADKRIESASAQIGAAEEELRIAQKRMQNGLGLNLDVLNAQRDRTQASINKAQAIVDFNIAQAQLCHDIGVISTTALTEGAPIQPMGG
jgi:outer membrane protein TolC